MLKEAELRQIIAQGETQEVEFKEGIPPAQELGRTACAFANTDGGIILFGVSSKKEIVGLSHDLDKVQQSNANCLRKVQPSLMVHQHVSGLDGKKILYLEISKSHDKIAHSYDGVVYVKLGSTIKKLEGESLIEFLKYRQIYCFDEQDSDKRIGDLDREKVQYYLSLREQPDYLKTHSMEDFLLSNQLARRNGRFIIKNVAVLFFHNNSYSIFPQSEIRFAQFSGTEAVEIVAQKDFKQDLLANVEGILLFMREMLPKKIVTDGTARRDEVYQYPLSALREIIINAVSHRDYFSYDCIQINMFSDRIEISNPGGLSQGLTKEFFGKRSVRRNPLTYQLLRNTKYVEGLGTGVPKIYHDMRKQGLSDPEFIFDGGFFCVVLRNAPSAAMIIEKSGRLNNRQKEGMEFITKKGSITSEEYAQLNEVSIPTAVSDINRLIALKYIKRVGKYRGAYYVVREEYKK